MSALVKEIPWDKCALGCPLSNESYINFLPCLHVICSSACLEKCSSTEGDTTERIKCPNCNRIFPLLEIKTGVKLGEFFHKKIKPEDVFLPCDHCRRDIPAVSSCIQCQDLLCSVCTEDHLEHKRDHQLETNLEDKKAIQFQFLQDIQNKCQLHAGRKIKYYCFVCRIKICERCVPDHQDSGIDHEVSTIADELAYFYSQIQSSQKIREKSNLAISRLEGKLNAVKGPPEWNDFACRAKKLTERALMELEKQKEPLLDAGRQGHDLNKKTVEDKINDLRRANSDSSSSIHLFNTIYELVDLDDLGILNVTRWRKALPQSDIPHCNIMLEQNFDGFVEENENFQIDDLVLPHLMKIFASMRLASVQEDSIPLPGTSSRTEIVGKDSTIIPNQSWKGKTARKSTAGRKLNGVPLGMPHLLQSSSQTTIAPLTPSPAQGEQYVFETPADEDLAGERRLADIVNVMSAKPSAHSSSRNIREGKREIKPKTYPDCVIHMAAKGKADSRTGYGGKRQKISMHHKDGSSLNKFVGNKSGRGRNKRSAGNAGGSSAKKANTKSSVDLSEFLEAPMDSIELDKPDFCRFPIQGWIHPEKHDECPDDDRQNNICTCQNKGCLCKENDGCCAICLDGSDPDDFVLLCDKCPRGFHAECHVPIIPVPDPDPNKKWRCNSCKPKELVEQELQNMSDEPGPEHPLTEANPKQFGLASKFLIEIYNIPEVPTIKFFFPQKYLSKYNSVPYHLNFLREKLCCPQDWGQQPFLNVKEFLLAFRQMFLQAFMIYDVEREHREHAVNCFKSVQELVRIYYHDHQGLFENIIES